METRKERRERRQDWWRSWRCGRRRGGGRRQSHAPHTYLTYPPPPQRLQARDMGDQKSSRQRCSGGFPHPCRCRTCPPSTMRKAVRRREWVTSLFRIERRRRRARAPPNPAEKQPRVVIPSRPLSPHRSHPGITAKLISRYDTAFTARRTASHACWWSPVSCFETKTSFCAGGPPNTVAALHLASFSWLSRAPPFTCIDGGNRHLTTTRARTHTHTNTHTAQQPRRHSTTPHTTGYAVCKALSKRNGTKSITRGVPADSCAPVRAWRSTKSICGTVTATRTIHHRCLYRKRRRKKRTAPTATNGVAWRSTTTSTYRGAGVLRRCTWRTASASAPSTDAAAPAP